MNTTRTRPSALSAKSFTRYEPPATPASPSRSRASTIASPPLARKSVDEDRQDVFNKKEEDDTSDISPRLDRTNSLPERFDELPIELASFTDRYELSIHLEESPLLIRQIRRVFEHKSLH